MLKKVIANPIKNDRKDEYLRMGAWAMMEHVPHNHAYGATG